MEEQQEDKKKKSLHAIDSLVKQKRLFTQTNKNICKL